MGVAAETADSLSPGIGPAGGFAGQPAGDVGLQAGFLQPAAAGEQLGGELADTAVLWGEASGEESRGVGAPQSRGLGAPPRLAMLESSRLQRPLE